VESLEARSVLMVGAGGLGAPAALALASAGLGRLLVIDPAPVESPDLVTQPLLGEADLGSPRAAATARALAMRFPALRVEVHAPPLEPAGAVTLARSVDLVLGAADLAEQAFLAGDAAAAAGRPLVHGGLSEHSVQLLTVIPGATGCLRCLFEGPPPRVERAGPAPAALGPLAGLAGSLLGLEALRLLTGRPGAYAGRLASYQARSGWSRGVPVPRRPGCAACGDRADDVLRSAMVAVAS
jgi:molybdopterin-synthase adenylyltransferase